MKAELLQKEYIEEDDENQNNIRSESVRMNAK